jgi:hypothetical protein
MKRTAQLLLLLLATWLLLAAPSPRLPVVLHAEPASLADEERARDGVEHAVVELTALQVARPPLLARLPVPTRAVAHASRLLQPPSLAPPDLREEVRRAQARRRVPRLAPQEPPWC